MLSLKPGMERITKPVARKSYEYGVCLVLSRAVGMRGPTLIEITMALIELNLEKPALKRTETTEETPRKVARPPQAEAETKSGESTAEESTATEKRGEAHEETGGGLIRRIAMIGALVGTVVAVRRWRKRRSASEEELTEFEEEWETASSE